MEHHEHSCGCGHDHPHEHGPSCGCGQDHPPMRKHEGENRPALTETQASFLDYLSRYHYLPVARFVTASSKEEDFSIVSLAPVFLQTPNDSMEQVRELGALLTSLEEGGYLSIDYDLPLSGYAYTEFKESALYQYFCTTVREAAQKEGFLGDTPVLELGSMAPLDC